MGSAEIKVILCDLDGVLRSFPTSMDEVVEYKYDLPMGSIRDKAFEKELLKKLVTGKISNKEWCENISQSLSSEFPTKNVSRAIKEWGEFPGVLNNEVLDILIAIRKKVPVALITNGSDKLKEDLEALGVTDHFEHIIYSSELGFAKPKKEIFEHALKKFNLKSEDAFFIDDSKSHTDAASKMGMRVHKFMGARRLKSVCVHQKLIDA